MEGAYKCLLLFVLVYCARPEDWIPGVGLLHLAKVTGLLTLATFGLTVRSREGGFRLPREMVYLLILLGQLFLASVLSNVWRGGAVNVTMGFAKAVLIVLVAGLTVSALTRLRRLLFVQVACVASVAAVAIIKGHYGRMARLQGVLGGMYDNPNDLALAIALALPLCFAFLLTTKNNLRKAAWVFVMFLMSYALLLTASRSGLLTVLAAGILCLWEFGVKQKRPHLVVLAGVAVMALFLAGGGRLRARIDATLHRETEASAYESAEQRTELLLHSVQVTLAHPLFGVGPGDFEVISGNWHEVHNMYAEMSSEAGVPALILLLLIFARTFSNLRKAKELTKDEPELGTWAAALYADVSAFAVGSMFAPVAFNCYPYFLVAYGTAMFGMAQSRNRFQSQPRPHIQASRLLRKVGLESKVARPVC